MNKPRCRSQKRWLYVMVFTLIFGGYACYALLRPVTVNSSSTIYKNSSQQVPPSDLDWPATGQAAVTIKDSKIIETSGTQKIVPTASVAKIITALVILDKYPLSLNQQGQIITINESDVALFNKYAAQNGSRIQVKAGEMITQYQLLQAILLPSANNAADSMAIWAYGSLNAYSESANNYLAKNGLTSTKVGLDASGLSPTSVSTAQDLVKLGEIAMSNPVIAQIVGQSSATGIPVVNKIESVNYILGQNNIIGIKTGNTDEAGGVFLGASKVKINGKDVTIITAVMGAVNKTVALQESLKLTKSAQNNFYDAIVAKNNQNVGAYQTPWGQNAPVVANEKLNLNSWKGTNPSASVQLQEISSKTKAKQKVGILKIKPSPTTTAKEVSVSLKSDLPQPSIVWRLTNPFN